MSRRAQPVFEPDIHILKTMLTFFGTILLLYILWIIVREPLRRYAARKYTNYINDIYGRAFGGTQGFPGAGQQSSGRRRRDDGRQSSPFRRKRKIFTREDGEYVDFEEIDVKAGPSAGQAAQRDAASDSYTPREPQVSDADWEEIR